MPQKKPGKRKMDSLPSLEELNEMYPSTESLDNRIYGTINKAARRGKIKKAVRITAKIVASLCVIIVLVSGVLMSVEASRTFILSRIITRTDDYIQINFRLGCVNDLKVGEFVISYMPDDFTLYDKGDFFDYGGGAYYLFRSTTRGGIMIQNLVIPYGVEGNALTSIVGGIVEDTELSIISVNGQTAYLIVTPTGESSGASVSWIYGRHVIAITANFLIDIDELLKIAEGAIIMLP